MLKLPENPVKSSFIIFLIAAVVVIALTGFWGPLSSNILPNTSWGLYRADFWENVLVEAHGMLLDLFVIGVIVLYVDNRRAKKSKIERYKEEIDDFRFWWSEESAYKILGTIKRLQAVSEKEIDLSNCFLEKMNLRNLDLSFSNLRGIKASNANLRGICLGGAKLEGGVFKNINLRGGHLNDVYAERMNCEGGNLAGVCFQGAKLSRANFRNTNLKSADFREADLSEVNFENADLRAANFKGAIKLTPVQLKSAKSLKDIKLDEEIEKLLQE